MSNNLRFILKLELLQIYKGILFSNKSSVLLGFNGMNFFCDFLKHFRNSCSTFCWYFRPNHLMLFSESYWVCRLNLLLLGWQVAFVPSKGHDEASLICSRVLFHFIDPVFYRFKGVFVSQIVADYCTNGVPIVHVNHGTETFMTTRIPDVHLHLLLSCHWVLTVWNTDHLLQVSSSNSYIVNFVEPILAESHRNWRLADTTISE